MHRLFLSHIILFFSIFSYIFYGYAADLDAHSIIAQSDKNLDSPAIRIIRTLVNDGEKTNVVKNYANGNKTFSIVLFPPNNVGVKYMRIDNTLMMYVSALDRLFLAPGFLRHINLDNSAIYVDDWSRVDYLHDYTAVFMGEEVRGGYETYVLKLDNATGKSNSAFYSRIVWIDKNTFVPIYQELYGKDGKLIKTVLVHEIAYKDGHVYPKIIIHRLANDIKSTIYVVDAIQFDISIEDTLFTKMNLNN